MNSNAETVNKSTLELLKKIMEDNLLNNFVLVGGNALALRLGHRISHDMDLFTNHNFYASQLSGKLQHIYGFTPDFIAENTINPHYSSRSSF